MLNLKFYSFKEKRPEHEQVIVFFSKRDSLYVDAYELSSKKVEYLWIDDEGNSYFYEEGFVENEYSLVVTVDGFVVTDTVDSFWCSEEDYWKSIDKACNAVQE